MLLLLLQLMSWFHELHVFIGSVSCISVSHHVSTLSKYQKCLHLPVVVALLNVDCESLLTMK